MVRMKLAEAALDSGDMEALQKVIDEKNGITAPSHKESVVEDIRALRAKGDLAAVWVNGKEMLKGIAGSEAGPTADLARKEYDSKLQGIFDMLRSNKVDHVMLVYVDPTREHSDSRGFIQTLGNGKKLTLLVTTKFAMAHEIAETNKAIEKREQKINEIREQVMIKLKADVAAKIMAENKGKPPLSADELKSQVEARMRTEVETMMKAENPGGPAITSEQIEARLKVEIDKIVDQKIPMYTTTKDAKEAHDLIMNGKGNSDVEREERMEGTPPEKEIAKATPKRGPPEENLIREINFKLDNIINELNPAEEETAPERIAEIAATGKPKPKEVKPEELAQKLAQGQKDLLEELRRQLNDTNVELFATSILDENRSRSIIRTLAKYEKIEGVEDRSKFKEDISKIISQPGWRKGLEDMHSSAKDEHEKTLLKMLLEVEPKILNKFGINENDTERYKMSEGGAEEYLVDIVDKYITIVDLIAKNKEFKPWEWLKIDKDNWYKPGKWDWEGTNIKDNWSKPWTWKAQGDKINGLVLSLAMSGGKTVMEGQLLDTFNQYAIKKGLKGVVVGKPTDLVNKMTFEGDVIRVDGKTFKDDFKFKEGKINVVSYKEMFEAGLAFKDGRTKGRNPFDGYIVLGDEIHELALSVPMITSTNRSEADILTDLGVTGRAVRMREKAVTSLFASAADDVVTMRGRAINNGNVTDPTRKTGIIDESKFDKAILEKLISTGVLKRVGNEGEGVRLTSTTDLDEGKIKSITGEGDGFKKVVDLLKQTQSEIRKEADKDLIDSNGGSSADLTKKRYFKVSEDGQSLELAQPEEKGSMTISNVLREKFSNHEGVDNDAVAKDAFLAHFDEFSNALAQVWSNEISKDNFRTEYVNGRFDLVTIERTRGGLENRNRVYTDHSGLNAYMKMIIAMHEVANPGQTVSEGEYIRLTERNLHTQITAMELMSLFPGFIGYTGTAEIIKPIFELKSLDENIVTSHGKTMNVELFNDRHLEVFTGNYKDTIIKEATKWEKMVEIHRDVARTLLVNIANREGREAAAEYLKQQYAGDKDVVVLESGAQDFVKNIEDELRNLKGKKVILLSSGESGASPDMNGVELWHYDFNMRGLYGHAQAIARADYLRPDVGLEIRRAKGIEYKQFVNADSTLHDSRLSDDQANTLRWAMSPESKLSDGERRMIVDQIMRIMEKNERTQALTQSMASIQVVNPAEIGEIMKKNEDNFIKEMVNKYKDANGIARIYNANGVGYQIYRTQENDNGKCRINRGPLL